MARSRTHLAEVVRIRRRHRIRVADPLACERDVAADAVRLPVEVDREVDVRVAVHDTLALHPALVGERELRDRVAHVHARARGDQAPDAVSADRQDDRLPAADRADLRPVRVCVGPVVGDRPEEHEVLVPAAALALAVDAEAVALAEGEHAVGGERGGDRAEQQGEGHKARHGRPPERRQHSRIGTRGAMIERGRRAIVKGLVRPLVVVEPAERVERALLGLELSAGWPSRLALEGLVNAFVGAVLLGMRGQDALVLDAQAQPPDIELREAVQPLSRERHAVVRADRTREPVLPEQPLEDRPPAVSLGGAQAVARQEIARVLIGHRQRITVQAVARAE